MAKRLIPAKTNVATTYIGKLTLKDILIALIFIAAMVLVATSVIGNILKLILISIILVFLVLSLSTLGYDRGYMYFLNMAKYLIRPKANKAVALQDITRMSFEEISKVGNTYSAIIEIKGIDFDILGARSQDEVVLRFADVIKHIDNGSLVKLEKPIDFSKYIELNNTKAIAVEKQKAAVLQAAKNQASASRKPFDESKLDLTGYNSMLDVLTGASEFLEYINTSDRIPAEAYYLVIYDSDPENLKAVCLDTVAALRFTGTAPELLNDEKVKIFYKYFYNCPDEDTPFIPEIIEKSNKLIINGKKYKVASVGEYPFLIDNAWGSNLFGIPKTTVVFNFSKTPKKNIYKNISRSITELNARVTRRTPESEARDIAYKVETLSELLGQLKIDQELLHKTMLYILYPAEDDKVVDQIFLKEGMYLDNCWFKQLDSYVSMFPYLAMPEKVSKAKEMQTTSLASVFPATSRMFLDEQGNYLGVSKFPVFFDLWQRDDVRRNSNMCVVGRSGNGKSYFLKKTVMQHICDQDRIFVLDPDNEYDWICEKFGGNWIDVGGVSSGTINPLQVFPSLIDDTSGEKSYGEVSLHRQFLESFFNVAKADMDKECRPFLNKCISELYKNFKITDGMDIAALKPEHFPIMDDLLKIIKDKLKKKDSLEEYEKVNYMKLENYIGDFASGGLHSKLWNGHTSLRLENKFTVLNFQSLFSNNNDAVANAQMLLIMRFLNQEVIRNRELVEKKHVKSNIIIIIDEAHRFIDPSMPEALTFMEKNSKQLRKYYAGQIVATQSIEDFLGVSEKMKAQASNVIGQCQYNVIFGLKENDINKIIELFANHNGGLTQTEIDCLVRAKMGEALFISDSLTRLIVKIDLFYNEQKYIERPKAA